MTWSRYPVRSRSNFSDKEEIFFFFSSTQAVKDGADFLLSSIAMRLSSSAQSLGKETFLIKDDNCSSSFSERSDISGHLTVLDFWYNDSKHSNEHSHFSVASFCFQQLSSFHMKHRK